MPALTPVRKERRRYCGALFFYEQRSGGVRGWCSEECVLDGDAAPPDWLSAAPARIRDIAVPMRERRADRQTGPLDPGPLR